MPFIRRIPLPMSALALGLAALGNLLLPYSPAIRVACGLASAAVALLVLARLAVDLSAVRKELANPAVLSVFPTLFMALMLLATYLKPIAPAPAFALWLVALVAQLVVVGVFAVRFLVPFKLAQVLPGWFVVFVGFVVASVTSPAFDMQPLGRVLLWAGIAGYFAVLPVVVYRVLKGDALPAPLVPTLAIFAAPASLCLVGYLAVMDVKQAIVVYALLAVAGASLLYVLASLPRILKIGFAPTYAALTFPVVISAIALKQSSVFLAKAGAFVVPSLAVTTMDVFAAAVVAFVLVRYIGFLATPATKPQVATAPATP